MKPRRYSKKGSDVSGILWRTFDNEIDKQSSYSRELEKEVWFWLTSYVVEVQQQNRIIVGG